MMALLELFNSPMIIGAVAAVAGMIAVYFRGRTDGKTKERGKQLERDAHTRRQNDEIIDVAERARRNAGADDLMSDDGFKRAD